MPPVPKPVSFRELTRDEAESNERRPAVSLTLVQTGGNLGFAGGCNVGVRHALAQGTDYVWLLNNDTLAARESLRQMVDHVRAHAGVGICGSTLLDIHRPSVVLALGGGRMRRSTGAVWSIGHGSRWPLPAEKMVELESQRMDYVVGASMLVSRSCLETAGLMDEGYFLYFEELDWAARLPPDFRLGYAPGSVVYHHEGGSSGGLLLSHFYRSLIRYTWRHNRRFLPGVLARMSLRFVEAVFTRNWQQLGALFSLVRPRRIPQCG